MNFKVGDVCIIVNTRETKVFAPGDECTIVGGELYRFWLHADTDEPREGFAYAVDLRGETLAMRKQFLRLKRPPSWDSWIYDTSKVQGEAPSKVEIVNRALLELGSNPFQVN